MANFWDFDAWGSINLLALLLISLLLANALKKNIKLLRISMIPTPVLAGLLLLLTSTLVGAITGTPLLEAELFSNKGLHGADILEIVTYHALALGFIAQTLKESPRKFTKKRSIEIFDSGVTTVATYLLQGVIGMGITIAIATFIMPDFFGAAGILLPFGYGQGTGQALNYGAIYETQYGFTGGKSFGLTIAALGFLSASIGGVIHLNIMRKKGKIKFTSDDEPLTKPEEVENNKEIPMNGSIDKLTVQVAFILIAYVLAFGLMYALGKLLPGMKSVIYGFNFLLGVIAATLIKTVLRIFEKKKICKKKYVNNFLMTHLSNLFFDVMVVAGIGAIRLDVVKEYWWILLSLGFIGLFATYFYNRYIAKKLFSEYADEQFLAMYGMLTGTASTGVMLLREVDPKYETCAADNLVYQTLPAIIFGFPMMLIATLAPENPMRAFVTLVILLVVMNVILFRRQIFKRKSKKK